MANAWPFSLTLPYININSGAPSYLSVLLDAAGEKAGYVFRAPKSGNIRNVHFRTGAVTTPTDTDVRIETVDASNGQPSGTLFGTNTNVTVASGSIVANTWIRSGNLTASAAVNAGDLLAPMIVPSGSPNFNISTMFSSSGQDRHPYLAAYQGGAWGFVDRVITAALEYDDGSFAYIGKCIPAAAINTHTFNNGSTPDEYALYVTMRVTARLSAISVLLDADGDFDIVVYDTDGTTALSTTSCDKDVRQFTTPGQFIYNLATPPTLNAGSTYRVAIKPSSATSLSIYSFDVNSAAILDQVQGGQDVSHSTRTDAGSWSQTATRRIFADLHFDSITAGAGGGASGVAPSGWDGGFGNY